MGHHVAKNSHDYAHNEHIVHAIGDAGARFTIDRSEKPSQISRAVSGCLGLEFNGSGWIE
jgi:hypothetical protein